MSGMQFFGNRPQTVADLFNKGGGIDFDNIPLQGFGLDPISQIGIAAVAQSMRSSQSGEPLGNSIRRMLNDMRGAQVFRLSKNDEAQPMFGSPERMPEPLPNPFAKPPPGAGISDYGLMENARTQAQAEWYKNHLKDVYGLR